MLALELLERQTRHRESLPSEPQPSPSVKLSPEIFWRPLVIPPFVIASLVAVGLGLAGLLDGLHGLVLSGGQQILLLGTLLLTARAHVSGVILLIAMLLGYVVIERALLTAPRVLLYQLDFLLKPWRLAVFALTMVLLAQAGRRIRQWNSWLLTGAFAQPGFYSPSPGWIFWPATIFAGMAAVGHTLNPGWREAGVQLWAPYLGAITFGLVAWFWLKSGFYIGAGTLLVSATFTWCESCRPIPAKRRAF